MSLRELLKMWPIALVVVAAPAVRIGFILAAPPEGAPSRPTDYPVRILLPQPDEQRAPAGREPIEFDSRASRGTASAIEIRKVVAINSVDAGSATIRVGSDSELAISAGELRRLLARAGHADLARVIGAGRDGGFVGFEDLRGQGIDVRYDVAADRIAIAA